MIYKDLARIILITGAIVTFSLANAMDSVNCPQHDYSNKPNIENVKQTYQELKKVADSYCKTYIQVRKSNNIFRLANYKIMEHENLFSVSQNLERLEKGKMFNIEEREFMEYCSSPDVPESSLSELQLKRSTKLQDQMINFFLGEEFDSRQQRTLSCLMGSYMGDLTIKPDYEPNQIYIQVFDQLGLTAEQATLLVLDYNFSKDELKKNSSHGYKVSCVAGILAKNLNIVSVRWKEFLDNESKIHQLTKETNELAEKQEEYSQRFKVWSGIGVSFQSDSFLNEIKEHKENHIKKATELIECHKANIQLKKQNKLDFLENLKGAIESLEYNCSHVISISINPRLLINNTGVSLTQFSQMLEERDLLLVFSAGNETLPLSDEFQSLFGTYPEIKKRMVFVGSTDKVRDISYFSNRPGKFSDMFIYAQGEHILKEISETDPICGTSYAAPYVASLFVLLKKYFPTYGMITLKDIVLDTADPFPDYVGGYDCVEIPNQERVSRFDNVKEIAGRGTVNPFKAFLECHSRSVH